MPQGHLRQLTAFGPNRQDHIPALRIALSVGAPLFLLLALGRPDLTVYASFGSFAALYARQEPLRDRFVRQSQAALMILLCICLGLFMSYEHLNEWIVVIVCSVVAGVGATAAALLNLKPSGSVFLIFASGAVGSLPHATPWPEALGAALLAVAWSLLAGFFGALLGEGVRGHVNSPPPRLQPMTKSVARYGLSFLVVPLVAGVLGQLSGLSHAYWAMVAAAAAISGPHSLARMHRSIQRVAGTFVGILITAFVLSQGLDSWHLVVYVVVFQFLTEIYVMRNYGFAGFFLTPLALLMLQLAHPGPSSEILTARLAETAIGGAVVLVYVLVSRTSEEKAADTQAMPVLRGFKRHQQERK